MKEQNKEIDVISLINTCFKYKIFIIVFTVSSGLLFLLHTFTQPEIYKAEVLIIPSSVEEEVSFGGAISYIQEVYGSVSTNKELDEIERLKTRSFLTKFIRINNYKPVLFPDKWSDGRWKGGEPSDIDSYNSLLEKINFNNSKDSNVMSLSIEWENPVNLSKVSEVANKLISSINNESKERSIAKSKRTISFIENEIKNTNIVKMKSILYSLLEQQIQNIVLSNVRDDLVFKVIDPAITPNKPEHRLVILELLLSMLVGLLVGLFLIVNYDYLKQRFKKY